MSDDTAGAGKYSVDPRVEEIPKVDRARKPLKERLAELRALEPPKEAA